MCGKGGAGERIGNKEMDYPTLTSGYIIAGRLNGARVVRA